MEKQLGPYEILGELGRGGMGVVYRARRADLGREFALKVIGGGVGSSSAGAMATPEAGVLVERFRREARAGAALAGVPGIVGVHDIGETDGRLYIAMDFIDGVSLDALIFEGELSPVQIAELMAKVCRAVAAAHAQGVLHRDLKPANILVTGDKPDAGLSPFITDFGLAHTTIADPDVSRLTKSGEIIGTPAYMAPEQALGLGVDGRADVYSLGACLYEACVGQPPFGGDSIYGVLTRVLREPPPPLRQRAPHVPEALERICLMALAKKPADRYASAAELAEDLERFARGEPILARRPANRVRRRALAVGGGALVLVAGAAAVIGAIATREDDTRKDLAVVTEELTTADRAIQVSGAYMELVRSTRRELQALEAHWNGHWLDGAEGERLLASLDASVDAVAARYPESALAPSWKALARFFGEVDTVEGSDLRLRALAEHAAAAGDDPYPKLLYARAALADYVKFLQLPAVVTSGAGVKVDPLQESDRLRSVRAQAAKALASAGRSPYWAHINEGRAALDLLAAIELMQRGEYRATAERLESIVEDPFLGHDARRLQVITWFLAGEYLRAARTGMPLVQARWIGAGLNVGRAWGVEAELRALRGEDHAECFEQALAAYTVDVEATSHKWAALVPRARCYIARAGVLERAGEDPTPDAERGIADIDRALPDHRAPAAALSLRGLAWQIIARWRESRGEDPAEAYRRAVADHRRAMEANPDTLAFVLNLATVSQRLSRVVARSGGDPEPILRESLAALLRLSTSHPELPVVWSNLGGAYKELARLDRRLRRDAMANYQAAIEATERALTLKADYGLAAYNLGLLWVERARILLAEGDAAGALKGFRAAIAVYDRAERINPRDHESITSRGVAHKAAADALVQLGRDPAPDLEAAVRNYDQALALQPEDAPTWYNRGNALSDLAARRASGGGEPDAVAQLRAQAAASYRACMTRRPAFWQASYRLGNVLEAAGDWAAAAAAYEQTLRLRPDLEPQLAPRIRALKAR